MGKINFTKENKSRLDELILEGVYQNRLISGPLGTRLSVSELLNGTTINSLITINSSLKKAISTMEDADEWSSTDSEKERLQELRKNQELVNLIIGYIKWNLEQEEIEIKKEELAEKIAALKEAQKTPAEKIADLEKQLAEL